MHTLVLGAGYSGCYIASAAAHCGTVCGTRRSEAGVGELVALGIPGIVVDGTISEALLSELSRVSHLVVSIAPGRDLPLSDPLLDLLASLPKTRLESGQAPPFANLQWIGYLSTVGVYGNHGGNWVDEKTPCGSVQARSLARRQAELAWQAKAKELQVPISILRLSGIYGPGRNALVNAIAGRARLLIKPGQYFNRIHVDDLATATLAAAQRRFDGVLNITDELPAAPQDVVIYAHQLAGKPLPEVVSFETADITPMARSFYGENKRVRNDLSKSALALTYRYPSYREGLDAIWQELQLSEEAAD